MRRWVLAAKQTAGRNPTPPFQPGLTITTCIGILPVA